MAVFLRLKRRRGHEYLVLVENFREGGRTRQRTIQSFGRRDRLDLDKVNQVLARQPGFAFIRAAVAKSREVAPRGADTTRRRIVVRANCALVPEGEAFGEDEPVGVDGAEAVDAQRLEVA